MACSQSGLFPVWLWMGTRTLCRKDTNSLAGSGPAVGPCWLQHPVPGLPATPVSLVAIGSGLGARQVPWLLPAACWFAAAGSGVSLAPGCGQAVGSVFKTVQCHHLYWVFCGNADGDRSCKHLFGFSGCAAMPRQGHAVCLSVCPRWQGAHSSGRGEKKRDSPKAAGSLLLFCVV